MIPYKKLCTSVSYLKVRHKEKLWYDLYYPLVLSLVLTGVDFVLPHRIDFFGKDGFLSGMTGLLQILAGFYIASLAAVATFQKPGLDDFMSGKPPELGKEKLTRRRFLCLLFAYLSAASIALYFIGLGAYLLKNNVVGIVPFELFVPVRSAFVLLYTFLLSNVMTTTLLALHYVSDKMHKNTPQIVQESSSVEEEEKSDPRKR